MRPCRQSTVLGTLMTLYESGTESSSSLQMMTANQRSSASECKNVLGWPFRAVTWARADWTLG